MSGPQVTMSEDLAQSAREVREGSIKVLERLSEHPGMSAGGKVAIKVACDALRSLEAQAETVVTLRDQLRTIVEAYDRLKDPEAANGTPVLELALRDAIAQARAV